tara:strand:+ start:2952 stop:3179 length:228 start_codon:yes stop_codon:yes gene_type:complete
MNNFAQSHPFPTVWKLEGLLVVLYIRKRFLVLDNALSNQPFPFGFCFLEQLANRRVVFILGQKLSSYGQLQNQLP